MSENLGITPSEDELLHDVREGYIDSSVISDHESVIHQPDTEFDSDLRKHALLLQYADGQLLYTHPAITDETQQPVVNVQELTSADLDKETVKKLTMGLFGTPQTRKVLPGQKIKAGRHEYTIDYVDIASRSLALKDLSGVLHQQTVKEFLIDLMR